jgi:D-3-phosphoglycerate dehydrogenase
LKVIARVGIGLDNVNVRACLDHGVMVTYTPDAPSKAVAELTVSFILNLGRHVHQSDRSVREQAWNRLLGRLLEELTIGVVGVGRIGGRVIALLQPFGCRILATDIAPVPERVQGCDFEWTDSDTLLRESDVVTLHIPANKANRHYLGRKELKKMKRGAFVINTSRGAVVDEAALVEALDWGHLAGAGLDVFESEPYEGPLATMDQTVLTAHMGASANKSRNLMELGATEDCLRVLAGEPPANPAPPEEV